MSQVPIIDISPLLSTSKARKHQVAEELSQIFHTTGFVGIQGHGVPSRLVLQMREQLMRLFELPLERKLALQVQQKNYRGYIPLGFFTPNASKQEADQYEGYKLHFEIDSADDASRQSDLYGQNRWPAELPKLQETVLNYWQCCDQLSNSLLAALAPKLDLPAQYFVDAFQTPLTNMTLLHYPPTRPQSNNFGIHPHKDTDALTILAPDEVGGLWLRPRNSQEWIDASVPADTLLVNVGDMLETWSAGYFQSTPHKVVNSSGRQRFSFPYFAVPRHDVIIEPLFDSHSSTQFPVASAGEISRKIWYSNWPDAAAIDQQYDPYTH